MEGPYYLTSIIKLDALSQVFAPIKDWDGAPKLLLCFTTLPLEFLCYYFGTCFRIFSSLGVTLGSDDLESLTNDILFFDRKIATTKEYNRMLKLPLWFTP